jgi:tRNA A37 threonylcarbamoyladenosine synthetase subunit TsaC/SUA5/YrdC
MTTSAGCPPPDPQLTLAQAQDISSAATALASGLAVGHGFGNFYAITSSPAPAVVAWVNRLKGRPPDQVGSAVTSPLRMSRLFAWEALPCGLTPAAVFDLMEHLLALGPFGFRGPAADHVPDHLVSSDGAVRTVQLISPGSRCPSNAFLQEAMRQTGTEFLHITSANLSRHRTGAADEPAHYRGAALARAFAAEPRLLLLHHDDDDKARARHPWHAPMSTTILAFHRLGGEGSHRVGSGVAAEPPRLLVERHGSLPIDRLREEVARFGFGIELGAGAQRRLGMRIYAEPPSAG